MYGALEVLIDSVGYCRIACSDNHSKTHIMLFIVVLFFFFRARQLTSQMHLSLRLIVQYYSLKVIQYGVV